MMKTHFEQTSDPHPHSLSNTPFMGLEREMRCNTESLARAYFPVGILKK